MDMPILEKYLVIGQGAIGSKVTNALQNLNKTTIGLARKERQHYDINNQVGFVQADVTDLVTNLDAQKQIQDVTHIAIIVTPDNYSVEGYQASYFAVAQYIMQHQALLFPELKRLLFVSSTGVYGQNEGQWIDEHTEPQVPKRASSQVILQTEQLLQEHCLDKLVIVRASGIYGVGRLMRVRKALETDKPAMSKYAWSNRIMDTDLVSIIVNAMTCKTPKSIYLATDYMPVTSFELTCWLSKQLQTTQPKASDDNISGKRLHSNIPKTWLQYPDWMSGYQMILGEMQNNQ